MRELRGCRGRSKEREHRCYLREGAKNAELSRDVEHELFKDLKGDGNMAMENC